MTRLQALGIDLSLPSGWDARIFRRPAERSQFTGAVAHAATFPLPADRGDFGSGAVEVMGLGDVLVVLFEYGPESVGTPLFASVGHPGPLNPDDFSPNALQRRLPSQAGVQRFFSVDGRAFCLYVVIGRHADRSQLAARANGLLAGLRISGH